MVDDAGRQADDRLADFDLGGGARFDGHGGGLRDVGDRGPPAEEVRDFGAVGVTVAVSSAEVPSTCAAAPVVMRGFGALSVPPRRRAAQARRRAPRSSRSVPPGGRPAGPHLRFPPCVARLWRLWAALILNVHAPRRDLRLCSLNPRERPWLRCARRCKHPSVVGAGRRRPLTTVERRSTIISKRLTAPIPAPVRRPRAAPLPPRRPERRALSAASPFHKIVTTGGAPGRTICTRALPRRADPWTHPVAAKHPETVRQNRSPAQERQHRAPRTAPPAASRSRPTSATASSAASAACR